MRRGVGGANTHAIHAVHRRPRDHFGLGHCARGRNAPLHPGLGASAVASPRRQVHHHSPTATPTIGWNRAQSVCHLRNRLHPVLPILLVIRGEGALNGAVRRETPHHKSERFGSLHFHYLAATDGEVVERLLAQRVLHRTLETEEGTVRV